MIRIPSVRPALLPAFVSSALGPHVRATPPDRWTNHHAASIPPPPRAPHPGHLLRLTGADRRPARDAGHRPGLGHRAGRPRRQSRAAAGRSADPGRSRGPGSVESLTAGQAAFRHVQTLASDIGVRVAGTEAERTAADYITARLRDYGYQVDAQPVPIRSFVSRSVDLRLQPDGRALRVSPLTNSPAGAAQGDLYDAGIGRPADYPAEGIAGRIALIQRGELTFSDKVRNAAAAGAVAAVIYDPPNDLIGGTLVGPASAIPALTIPGADGVQLRDRLKREPVAVTLAFDGGVEETSAINVIGRTPGRPCEAVVGGHFDSVAGAPGASDNATGTAVMLEMARQQGQRGNPENACFIAFGAEELGLVGSMHYLSTLSVEERRAIKFMLNFDMVAVGEEWLFIGSPALQRRAQEVAAANGITGRRSELLGASSDHAAFIDRRIPALMLHRSYDGLLHTPRDVVDRVKPEPLDEAVRLGMAFLAAFAAG
ncbi:MAG: M28 family peptidase [Dehalococcoidia bacterium]